MTKKDAKKQGRQETKETSSETPKETTKETTCTETSCSPSSSSSCSSCCSVSSGIKKFLKLFAVGIVLAILFPPLYVAINSPKTSYIIPNLLLFFKFEETVKQMWLDRVHIDRRVFREATPLPEIQAVDFSFETLRDATEDFRYPAVVRGFFNNTLASQKWADPDYLPSLLGDWMIPVVANATIGNKQAARIARSFGDTFRDIVLNHSRNYIFFPIQSRTNLNYSALSTAELQKRVNEIVRQDLDLDRIWPGFGGPNHKNYHASQIIAGWGGDDEKNTTGTGWHCAAGNNWFVQIIGGKRWYFLDPIYSPYMFPVRIGKFSMKTSKPDMATFNQHLPLKTVEIYPGDMIYNPDWEWHIIYNKPGLSIGVPLREVNFSLAFRNNFHYTTAALLNKALEKIGLDLTGE